MKNTTPFSSRQTLSERQRTLQIQTGLLEKKAERESLDESMVLVFLAFQEIANRHGIRVGTAMGIGQPYVDYDQAHQAAVAKIAALGCAVLGTLIFVVLSMMSMEIRAPKGLVCLALGIVGIIFARIAGATMSVLTRAESRNPGSLRAIRFIVIVSGCFVLGSVSFFMWLRFIEDSATLALISFDLLLFELSIFCLGAAFEARSRVLCWSSILTSRYTSMKKRCDEIDLERQSLEAELEAFVQSHKTQICEEESTHEKNDIKFADADSSGSRANGRSV